MSAEQFSKLSLEEEMVTTRAGAARARRSESGSEQSHHSQQEQEQNQDQPLESVETSSSPSSAPSLVISTNNLQYNVSALDSDLRRRVKTGMEESELKMKYCALATDEEIDGVKRFYIDDDVIVTIGGTLDKPKCTCGANEKGIACKHIYWLVDQIFSTAPGLRDEQPLQISPDGSSVQSSSSPVDILNDKGLDTIAGDLKWVVKKKEFPADNNDMKDGICNMLSVFEPQDLLPGEFKVPESPLTSERSRKYQDFAKVITEYAMRDPGLFIRMRDIVDPSFQRRVFFEKIDTRIKRTFHALDEYIAHGTMDAGPAALRFDVPNCAHQLIILVDAIDAFCSEQDEDDPDTKDVVSRAAAALISILERVVDRNYNAYAQIVWGLEAPDDPSENNLFFALIGSHVDGQPPFVLDALRSLPQENVLRDHWETLQSIEFKLGDNQAPPSYTSIFRSAVHESRKRAASEIREGEAKRTMQEEHQSE